MTTENKEELKDTLRESEERFRKIFEYSNDAIFVIDLERDRIADANPKACRMLGYLREELLSMSMNSIHPNEIPQLRAFSQSVLKHGYGWTNELSCMTKSGSTVPSEISASIMEMSGKPCLIAMVRDITDRKRAEASLRESEQRLASILESAMDAIITFDQEGTIQLFNAAAERAFRCTGTEVCGKTFDKFLTESFRKVLRDYVDTANRDPAKNPHRWIPEGLIAIRSDGDEFPVEATLSASDVKGTKLYTIILRDMNDRRKAEAEIKSLQLANVYLQEEIRITHNFEEIIGKSKSLRKVLRSVEDVAGTDSSVLITGETGTGKELVARAIHNLSQRRKKPLIKVNVAALPAGLIESELFGHEKGSFTGAIVRKIGRFELANGGTLFLDEIGDIPHDVQAKLLRVLQEKEFERVGGTRSIKSDVRLIAATNRDLGKAVSEKSFRADLYYRLNVFPVHLPPLRERKEDIPILTQYFVNKYATRMDRRIEVIPTETMERLAAYPWPGNIRELENVIERAVILTKGPSLTIEEGLLPDSDGSNLMEDSLRALEEVEREHIEKTLEKTRGVIDGPKGAARILKLHANTLRSRMKKLGMKR